MKRLLLLVILWTLFFNGFSQDPIDELNCGVDIELEKGFLRGNIELWPSQIIPYYISDQAESGRNAILRSITYINSRTNVCMVPRKSTDKAAINFFRSPNTVSTSTLGYRENGTTIRLNLSTGGNERTIQHEILHSLGFSHEHQRPDRDDYILVNLFNANPDYVYAFSKREGKVFTPYDYGSIMHYSAYAFSINGEPTLRAKNGAELGRGNSLSEYDIQDINHHYPKKLNCDSLLALFPPKPSFRMKAVYGSWCKGYELSLINESIDKEKYQSYWEISSNGNVMHTSNSTDAFFNLEPENIRVSLTLSNIHGTSESSRNLELLDKNIKINITPNPIEGPLTFSVEGDFYKMAYHIFDIHGNRLFKQELQRSTCEKAEEIEVAGIGAGVYFLQVTINDEMYVKRFIVP